MNGRYGYRVGRERQNTLGDRVRLHWRKIGLYILGSVVFVLLIIQMIFPWGSLSLYSSIDGVDVGGQPVDAVTSKLDKQYQKLPIGLYFANNPKAYRQPVPSDIGLSISTKSQVQAKSYSFWLRLIPTSLWWAHLVSANVAPTYKHDVKKASEYVQKELGQSCDVKPQNVSVEYKDKKLKVLPAIDGGTCKLSDVEQLLGKMNPRLNDYAVRVPMNNRPALLQNPVAVAFIKQLTDKSKDVSIRAGTSTVVVPQETFLTWLDFEAPDSGLVAKVNVSRSADFLDKELAPKVVIKPGTSRITTYDFTEVSRVDGSTGQALDAQSTIRVINEWLAGSSEPLVAQVRAVAPTPVFNRSYSATDTGLTALITQFAQSHPGVFGVSLAEIDGKGRRATYQDTKIFRTASTYKLFVAYSTLKRIESRQFHWTDQINGGRDLTKCFDDMIVKSDNACSEALLNKIGFQTITNEMRAIGLSRSGFLGDYPETTAGDLTTFVGSLYVGQLLSSDSTDRLISAMKRNIFRQGIPAGAKVAVADKVGFLDGLLHDSGVVYSPNGTYVLTIMTDGSSWGAIADLTRQIEALRSQPAM
ncbi:MAG: serine hydrolase [Candidatus Saccharimonadales bacterium]